ncbi:hypothetical protein J2X36_000060 [Methylobacterium sp. BE186]|nr:hypothetical protein [Methylobacterium sp. BE186]
MAPQMDVSKISFTSYQKLISLAGERSFETFQRGGIILQSLET